MWSSRPLELLTWISIVVLSVRARLDVESGSSYCPPWLDHGNGSCFCKEFKHNRFLCEDNLDIEVQVGNCITWDDSINSTVMTDCPYFSEDLAAVCHDLRYTIPANVTIFNITSYVCSQFNRMGTHCGECISGYGPAPFLNGANIPCAKCHHHNYLWFIILFLQLFMVTVLYFIVVLCECRGASSPLNVMAYFYQIIISALTSNAYAYAQIRCIMQNLTFLYICLNICAFWTLDFFRYSLPAVCVSPSLTNAQVLLFDYLVALFPVVLTLLSYLLISLHDKGMWLIVRAWRPFNIFISRYKKEWNPKQSIISAFATFLLLSYSKLLLTSINLLYGVPVYNNKRNIVSDSPVLYYDSTIEYFGLKHLPYVFLSLSILVTFVIVPPLILILYPTRCFKRLLERCRFKRWHSLSIVMDVFQGWYKDGTNGTYDFRALSALYMVLRISFAGEFILVLMFQYRTRYDSFEWTLPSLVHFALGSFFFAAKPYKKAWMNIVDGLMLILMGTAIIFMIVDDYSFGMDIFLVLLPVLVAGVYLTRRCIVKTKPMRYLETFVKLCSRRNIAEEISDDNDLFGRQCDRINPLQPSLSFDGSRIVSGGSYGSVN